MYKLQVVPEITKKLRKASLHMPMPMLTLVLRPESMLMPVPILVPVPMLVLKPGHLQNN